MTGVLQHELVPIFILVDLKSFLKFLLFCIILWVQEKFLGGEGSGWGRSFFLTFWNIHSMGFPMIYNTNTAQTQLLGRAGSGWGRPTFLWLLEISFPWAFQQYKTQPYLMNKHFWSFLGPSLLGAGSGWSRPNSFWDLKYFPSGGLLYMVWRHMLE